MLQLSHRYRTQQLVGWQDLMNAIDGEVHGSWSVPPLEMPFWRQCCVGRGVDITRRRLIHTELEQQRKLWSCSRTLEEAWNLVTCKLV